MAFGFAIIAKLISPDASWAESTAVILAGTVAKRLTGKRNGTSEAKDKAHRPGSAGAQATPSVRRSDVRMQDARHVLREHKVALENIDVRDIRARLEMSQREFATFCGVSVHTLRNWEQGRRRPEGPARVLLLVVDREPEAVFRAVHG